MGLPGMRVGVGLVMGLARECGVSSLGDKEYRGSCWKGIRT